MSPPGELSASRLARCITFLALSFSISWLLGGNRLASLVHPRMNAWIVGAGLLFLILALVQLFYLSRGPRAADPITFFVPIIFAICIVYIYIASGAYASIAGPAKVDSLAVQNAIISKRDAAAKDASSGPLPGTLRFDDDHYWASTTGCTTIPPRPRGIE
jgi:hypothetical protein